MKVAWHKSLYNNEKWRLVSEIINISKSFRKLASVFLDVKMQTCRFRNKVTYVTFKINGPIVQHINYVNIEWTDFDDDEIV